MTGGGVQITGLRPTINALRAFGVDGFASKEALTDIGKFGKTLAQAYTPVISGRLRRATRMYITKTRARVIQGSPPGVRYAGVVNFGRSGVGGSRHMQKVDVRWVPYASARLEKAIRDSSRKHGLA